MSKILINTNFQILTPTGFKDFHGIRKLTKNVHYVITLSNNKIIKCSDNHPFIFKGVEIKACELKIGSQLDGANDIDVYVTNVTLVREPIELYDIVNVSGGNIFLVDGIVSHNCDFSTSGNQVVSTDILEFYKQTHVKDPIERRGVQQDLWIWNYPDYSKNYMISADCARGDGGDFSAFHVIDVESLEQVAEYKGQLTTKDYGNLLVSIATEYNNGLLVVENNNQGWATLQQIIDRNYQNTFYSAADLAIVDVEKNYTNKLNTMDKKLVPGFTTTSKTRPLIISNMELFFRQKQVVIKSIRLVEELNVFIWNGPKAEAMKGYNDDLVMSFGMGMWVRETALRLRNEQILYNKLMLSKISRKYDALSINKDIRDTTTVDNHMKNWEFSTGGTPNAQSNGKKESLTWLL